MGPKESRLAFALLLAIELPESRCDAPALRDSMNTLDRVFVAVFARFRRRFGEESLKRAWRAAAFNVKSYVFIASTAFLVPLFLAASPSPAKLLRSPGSIYAIVIGAVVAVSICLDRRWGGFLNNPPPTEPTEQIEDARLIRVFHLTAVALFLIGCVSATAIGRYFGLNRH